MTRSLPNRLSASREDAPAGVRTVTRSEASSASMAVTTRRSSTGRISHSPSRVRSQLTPAPVVTCSVPGTAQTAGSVLPSASTALRCHGAGEAGSRKPNV